MKTPTTKARLLLTGVVLAALAASTVARADYQSTVVSQSPVGYWRLNETTSPSSIAGAANLGSLGAAAIGAYNSFPTRGVAGPFAGSTAVGLDGGAANVTTPWVAGLNGNPFTYEVWANPGVVPKFAYLASSVHIASPRSGWYMAQDDGTTFGLGSAFVVRMFYQNGATPSVTLAAPVSTAGVWYHIVLTFDGTTASLYTNGVLAQASSVLGYVANGDSQTSLGSRSDNNFFWPGKAAEMAMYNSALSAARVSAHYSTATTTPANYASTVLADSPVLYYRFQEPVDPPAANLGTLGTAGSGLWIYDAKANVAGPAPPAFPGFDAGNKAAAFDGGGGVVRLPNLNLNTNTVTICAWVNATNAQPQAAGIVVCKGTTTEAGLTIDQVFGGYGLGYIWNGNNYGWSPTSDSGLPALPDSQWAFVALVINPTSAALYICDTTNFGNFTSVVNSFNVSHPAQAFDGPTLVGAEGGFANRNFNGGIDEVGIWNRALSAGELYTQYATAVGGVPPRVFTDLQGPSAPVAVGDPITLTIDAGGTPGLTYTWHKNGSTIATTSTGTYTIASSALTDSGNYDVTVSNSSGSVPSQSVAVTVVTPTLPSITGSQGFKNRTLYPGGSLNLALTATGGGLKYHWYKNTVLIPSATSSAFTIASVASGDAGNYSVSVTNSVGGASNGPVTIAIGTATAGSYEALMVGSAPEAWWRLNEAPGTTNLFDAMGRHDGLYTNFNGQPVTLGAAGALSNDPDTAASFGGSGGLGVIPYSTQLNPQQYTIEAWVNTTINNGQLVPVSSSFGNNGWWIETIGGWWYGNCSAGYFGNNGNVNTAAQIAPGQWTHVVIEYDGSRVIGGTHYPNVLYVNAQTDGFVWGGVDPNSVGPFIIGGRGVSAATLADRLFNGQVDEVAFYDRLVPQAELQNHFNGRFGASTPPYFVGTFLPQTVSVGKRISYSTTAYGSVPLSLQWYKNGSKIIGATTTSLSIASAAVSDTGTYTIWATNGAGTASQSVNVTVIPTVGYANVTNGLVLHMRMDGDTTDSSGRGNNGTPVASPGFVPGLIGSQAVQVSTTTSGGSVTSASYVNLGRPSDLLFNASSSFSVSLWIKEVAGSEQGDLPFIGTEINSANNPGWLLCPSYQAGGWQWDLNDGTYNFDQNGPNDSINDGAWHHFVVTVDRVAHVASGYMDGVLTSQLDITFLGSLDNGSPVLIGQDPTGIYPEAGTNYLDDIAVWSRALSPLEVAKIESAGRTAGRSLDTVAPPVTMAITKSGANVTISWTTGTLLQSDTLGASAVWTQVPGATAPSYTFTPGSGAKFYRVFVQ